MKHQDKEILFTYLNREIRLLSSHSHSPFVMASQAPQLHFILFPLMAQGHMIPMIDIARLLAERGIVVTIITTPLNANRFKAVITRAVEDGLQIRVVQLHFPRAGELPEGCENFDMLPTLSSAGKFFAAIGMLQPPVEELFEELNPLPSCIISDFSFPWTAHVAHKFHIPNLLFHGTCCFSFLCLRNLQKSGFIYSISSESDHFLVPGMPDQIELTKAQLPGLAKPKIFGLEDLVDQIREAEKLTYGIVVNTFEELEPEYVKEYAKEQGKKVWCIGPVSLCNKNELDKAERGNKASIDEKYCFKWLDSWEPFSVIYACLGSLSRMATSQMIELGLALEESERPFIWVVRHKSDEFKKWLQEEGFEKRNEQRGLLIHGWAPQVLILSHPAIGGFLTHCGWNSTLEGVCAGLPLMTWPMFAEQFINEKLIVQVLRIGVSFGVEVPVLFGEEEKIGVLVRKNDIKVVIDRLMDGGDEGAERRKRARELGEMAKRAMEEGGSSHLNLIQLIRDVMEHASYAV